MVENENCLQRTSGISVPCREFTEYYSKGVCRFRNCRARDVLGNPRALEKVVGGFFANHLGPEDERTMRLVFHETCPGLDI